jgi:geranylgeranyl pyrophosphate synthase
MFYGTENLELSAVYKPVQDDLDLLQDKLDSTLKASDIALAQQIGAFIAESPGKRIRPALVALSARAAQTTDSPAAGDELINVAAAMELVHVASLIHDDVIDKSPLRHNRPTVNMKWKEEVGILFGDYVYSLAIGLIAESGNNTIFTCLSDTVTLMCEGQLAQVTQRDNYDLSTEAYISIVSKKTASLFSACCRIGAVLAGGEKQTTDALAGYGLNMGIAYQIIDDYRDVVDLPDRLGKDPGQDILLGEMTLPIMNLLATAKGEKKTELIELLKAELTPETMDKIRQEFLASDAVAATRKTIMEYIGKAKDSLTHLPASESKTSLASLVDILAEKISTEVKV